MKTLVPAADDKGHGAEPGPNGRIKQAPPPPDKSRRLGPDETKGKRR